MFRHEKLWDLTLWTVTSKGGSRGNSLWRKAADRKGVQGQQGAWGLTFKGLDNPPNCNNMLSDLRRNKPAKMTWLALSKMWWILCYTLADKMMQKGSAETFKSSLGSKLHAVRASLVLVLQRHNTVHYRWSCQLRDRTLPQQTQPGPPAPGLRNSWPVAQLKCWACCGKKKQHTVSVWSSYKSASSKMGLRFEVFNVWSPLVESRWSYITFTYMTGLSALV